MYALLYCPRSQDQIGSKTGVARKIWLFNGKHGYGGGSHKVDVITSGGDCQPSLTSRRTEGGRERLHGVLKGGEG